MGCGIIDSAIYIFDKFVVQGENNGQKIKCADFQVLIDDIANADADKCIFSYTFCM